MIKSVLFGFKFVTGFWILDPESHPYQIIWIWKIKIPCAQFYLQLTLHTAQTKYRNFETNIPRKGISGPQSQFPHSRVFPPSACLFCWRKYVDCSWAWDYINRSQAHECGNWGWGRAIPRKGIQKWDFLCSAQAVLCEALDLLWLGNQMNRYIFKDP